jgi:hypothetical protein
LISAGGSTLPSKRDQSLCNWRRRCSSGNSESRRRACPTRSAASSVRISVSFFGCSSRSASGRHRPQGLSECRSLDSLGTSMPNHSLNAA